LINNNYFIDFTNLYEEDRDQNMKGIYVSTNCLKNPKNVISVLSEYEKAQIENVELGSIHSSFDIKKLKKFNFNFLIHNYFPPPKNEFNFNLASFNKSIKKNSLDLAKRAIDMCCEIESPLYTFHAGFTVDPTKLGRPFPKNHISNRKKSLAQFFESVRELVEYSQSRGIKIAMEPNVVQKFNLVVGKNELCLLAEFFEIKKLLKLFRKKELGILLDLGHTVVTSHWLNFDKNKFVKNCQKRVYAVHISNNDGKQDQHKGLSKNCWQISQVKLFKNVPIILETMNLSTEKIKVNIQMVKDDIS